jgi:hypothetical protein
MHNTEAGVDEECEPPVLPGTPRLRTFGMRCALSVRRRSCGTTSVVEFLDHTSLLRESGKSGRKMLPEEGKDASHDGGGGLSLT